MKKYSVLLLYPDYANDDGTETFYGWTKAITPQQAVASVQADATARNEGTIDDCTDFAVLLVLEGHVEGLCFASDL